MGFLEFVVGFTITFVILGSVGFGIYLILGGKLFGDE